MMLEVLAYSRIFEGATTLIPMVHPQIDMTVFPILGRILSHGYLVCGHLPVRIVLPVLIRIILGPTLKTVEMTSKVLLDAFLDYISSAEREVFQAALRFENKKKFPEEMQDSLLNVLSKLSCRTLPTPQYPYCHC